MEAKANSFPGEDEAEAGGGRDAALHHGQHEMQEGVHARVAVDDGDLLHLTRHAVEEALHDPGGEADIGEDGDEDEARARVGEASRANIRW